LKSVITNGNLAHAHLGNNNVAISEQFICTVMLIKEANSCQSYNDAVHTSEILNSVLMDRLKLT